MKIHRQLLISSLILIIGGLVAFAIIIFPPQTEQQDDVNKPPSVHVMKVKLEQRLRLDIRSQGRIMAQTEIDLISGVSGNIIQISPNFVSGGFFKKGDLLLMVDPAEYDLRVAQAQAAVMEAQYQLTHEEAEAEQARDEWEHLGQGNPSPLSLRIPQLKEKKAKLVAEKEELKNARLLRQRTEIRAPFNGRVRNKEVGLGQYLSSGAVLGRIYSSDLAEVRLPLNTHELAFVDFPDLPDHSQSIKGARVRLTAKYRGQYQTWLGYIVRSEGVVNRETGMTMLVAQIPDPFSLVARKTQTAGTADRSVSLPMDLFVEAIIEGNWFDNLVILPARALLKDDLVAVVDSDNRLRFRAVEVLRREHDLAFIQAGLNKGERVFVAGLHHPLEGMLVSPIEAMMESDQIEQKITRESSLNAQAAP